MYASRNPRRSVFVALAVLLASLETNVLGWGGARDGATGDFKADLLIVGATESGWAAAIQAARMGVESIAVVHDGTWIGGQFTEQALACVDENKGVGKVGWGVDWHPMKRSFHRSGLFKEWMDRMESFNRHKYGDSMPGRPYHGPSTFRPVEAEAIFRQMLQPYLDSGQIRLWTNRYPVEAEVVSTGSSESLAGLRFADVHHQADDIWVHANLTIDASDWGEAIQLSGAAYEFGPDPQSRYGEPSAPVDLSQSPGNEMNPITWAMIVVEREGAVPIEKPDRYDDRNFVRTSRLSLEAMKDLAWDRPVRLGSIQHWPDAGSESPRQLSILTVRRIVDGSISPEGQTIVLLNYMLGQDYPLERLPAAVVEALERNEPGASQKNIVQMTRPQRQIVFDDAKRHSRSLLYHLQNFVHDRASDKTNSFRNYELSNEFGTVDRLPPKPYIRESLRLKAMYMMREQDGRNSDGATKEKAKERFSQVIYPDGVLCWQFHYDFHRTGRAYLKDLGNTGPWIDFEKPGRHTHHVSDRSVFPLRSLIPEKMDGLLGAQKNLGYSSIVSAAIRLHDQCMALGQAAGAAAAVSLRSGIAPREIPYRRDVLEAVRDGLCRNGLDEVPLLLWPYRDLAPDHEGFVAINRLAALGIHSHQDTDVDFRPDEPADEAWQRAMWNKASEQVQSDLNPSIQDECTRAVFCQRLWEQVSQATLRDFPRHSPFDADADGIPDSEDPSLFNPGEPVIWKLRPPTPLQPHEDGIPSNNATNQDHYRVNFASTERKSDDAFQVDTGHAFSSARGFGWQRDNQSNTRERQVFAGQARDTFAFTRDAASWEMIIPNGSWRVTVCVGDASHEQTGQRVKVEGVVAIDRVDTVAGHFHEATVDVVVQDGRLTIDLGPQEPSCNTCVNWIVVEKASP